MGKVIRRGETAKTSVEKTYRVNFNIGKAKYVISYNDGVKIHKDGSKFFDMAIFKSKKKFNAFKVGLEKKGYKSLQ